MTRTNNTAVSNKARLRFTLSGVLWIIVAAVVGGLSWWKSINIVLLIVYVMVLLLILNGILALMSVVRTRVGRSETPPVFAGEQAECVVVVGNDSQRVITTTVSDVAGRQNNTYFLYRLPGNQIISCSAPREFPNRGRFRGNLTVSSAFPFGFVECVQTLDGGADFIVLPRPGVAEADGLRRWLFRHFGDGRTRRVLRRVTSDQAEVRGVRAYRTGDSIRDIHWRTTARRGELMVREYDASPSVELVLVVEPWLPPDPTPGDYGRLESALSLATTIAITWRRSNNSLVTVIVAGAGAVAETASSDAELRRALSPLADVRGAPLLELVPPSLFGRHLTRSARVVVSSRAQTPYAGLLSRSTGRPFIAISPSDRLPWYQPPISVVSDA